MNHKYIHSPKNNHCSFTWWAGQQEDLSEEAQRKKKITLKSVVAGQLECFESFRRRAVSKENEQTAFRAFYNKTKSLERGRPLLSVKVLLALKQE